MSKKAMTLALGALQPESYLAEWYVEQEIIPAAIKALEEALAKQEQGEPVAWVDERSIAWLANHPRGKITTSLEWQKSFERPMPLYTTPQPAQKPLTDEQIEAIAKEHIAIGTRSFEEFARRIEAAHGIKE